MGKEKSKKRRRSPSSNNSSSSSSSDSSREKKKLRKLKKKLKKEQKKTEKALKKKMKEEKRKHKKKHKSKNHTTTSRDEPGKSAEDSAADVPLELMEKSKAMAPMTKEEWEKRQSVVRKVLDEETGRYRLIKGDGEVLEEIVSRDRHKQINRQATQADGEFFQAQTLNKKSL